VYERQQEICPPDKLPPVTIIGCGGIGSRTAEVLAAMGIPKLELWDADEVEEANLGPQLYHGQQLGTKKASALAANILRYNQPALSLHQERYTAQPLQGIVVLAVDSLAERKRIYGVILRRYPSVQLLIDARMGWELGKVYVVPMKDEWSKEEFAASLERIPMEVPCSARAVAYNVFGLAAWIAAAIKSYSLGQSYPWRITVDYKAWFCTIQWKEEMSHV